MHLNNWKTLTWKEIETVKAGRKESGAKSGMT